MTKPVTPFIYDFTYHQGDTFSGVQFPTTLNGVAWNLTGAAMSMVIKRASDGTIFATLGVGTGLTILNAITGSWQIDAQRFLTLTPDLYYYEVTTTIGTVVKTYHGGAITCYA